MAKFVMEDGNVESWDNIKEENQHKISRTLIVEMRFLETLKDISKNLEREDLNHKCIMEMIKGEPLKCEYDKNCRKCICNWYMKEG